LTAALSLTGLTGLRGAFAARPEAAERTGLAWLGVRRTPFFDALTARPVRVGFRLEVVRAFTARRSFAMPGG
jgi:hypothetical protein